MRVAPEATLVDAAKRTQPGGPEGDESTPDGTSPIVVPADVWTGRVLGGRYRLHERVGRGATAVVHRAWDALLCRDVAVKVFDRTTPDPAHEQRRLTEMQALAAVDHPGLVKVFDAAVGDPADVATPTYLVMEFVPGATLADRPDGGPVPEEQVRPWAVTLARALAEMHAADLVHRDVKPANVLLGATGSVKLGDFGLARPLRDDPRVTPAPDVLGTPAYLSPEQAASEHVGPASDVYSLGLVLLECLTGRREYPGEAISAALARLLRSPAVPAELPAPWPGLLTAMTDREPDRRPTAAEVATALDSQTTLDALFVAPEDSPSRWRSLRMLAGSALVAAAAAGLMALGGALFGASPTSPVGVSPAAADPAPAGTVPSTASPSITAPSTTPASSPSASSTATSDPAAASTALSSTAAVDAPSSAEAAVVAPVSAESPADAAPSSSVAPAPDSVPASSAAPPTTAAPPTSEAPPAVAVTAAPVAMSTPSPEAAATAPAGPAAGGLGNGPGRNNGDNGNGNGPAKPDGSGPGNGNGNGNGNGLGGPGRG